MGDAGSFKTASQKALEKTSNENDPSNVDY